MELELLYCQVSVTCSLTAILGETYDMFARLCSVSAPRPHFAWTSRFEEAVVAAGPVGSAVVVPVTSRGVGRARGGRR